MYDAIVVGARCAGSSAAMHLARKGYKVLLVDRLYLSKRYPIDSHDLVNRARLSEALELA
jgi:glycine/D-amino acid oxidase-like deaminating enzyme